MEDKNYFYYAGDHFCPLSDFLYKLFPTDNKKQHRKRREHYHKNKTFSGQKLFSIQDEKEGYKQQLNCELWGFESLLQVSMVTLHIPPELEHPDKNNYWDVKYFDLVREILPY